MSNLKPTLSNTTVELTAKGVFEIKTTSAGGRKRRELPGIFACAPLVRRRTA